MAAAGLTACDTGGGGAQPAAVSTLSTGAAVSGEITFWHAYSAGGGEIKALEKTIIPNFEKLHPGVKVKAVQIPDKDMHQKLVTAAAGTSLPDVIRLGQGSGALPGIGAKRIRGRGFKQLGARAELTVAAKPWPQLSPKSGPGHQNG